MVQRLKPVVELNSAGWSALLSRYRLDRVMSAAHVQMLWQRMLRVMHAMIWYEIQTSEEAVSTDHRDIVLSAATLGAGVDALISEWSDGGQILDAYAADCLAMEALQCLYRLLEDQLAEQNVYITRYCFPEPDREGRMQMAAILETLQCGEDIQLSDEGMLKPMKSVIFSGILTENREERCGTICENCGRTDCPNRYSLHMGNYREPGALKYSYGYQRIFGKS